MGHSRKKRSGAGRSNVDTVSDELLNSQPASKRTWSHETRLERAGKRQTVYNIVHKLHNMQMSNLIDEAEQEDISVDELKGIITELKQKGLVYTPKPGYVGCVDD